MKHMQWFPVVGVFACYYMSFNKMKGGLFAGNASLLTLNAVYQGLCIGGLVIWLWL